MSFNPVSGNNFSIENKILNDSKCIADGDRETINNLISEISKGKISERGQNNLATIKGLAKTDLASGEEAALNAIIRAADGILGLNSPSSTTSSSSSSSSSSVSTTTSVAPGQEFLPEDIKRMITELQTTFESMKETGPKYRYNEKTYKFESPSSFSLILGRDVSDDFEKVEEKLEKLIESLRENTNTNHVKVAHDLKENFKLVKEKLEQFQEKSEDDSDYVYTGDFLKNIDKLLARLSIAGIAPSPTDSISKLSDIYAKAKQNNDHILMGVVMAQLGDTLGYMRGSSTTGHLGIEFNKSTRSVRMKAMGEGQTSLKSESPLFQQKADSYWYSDDTIFSDMVKQVLDRVDLQLTESATDNNTKINNVVDFLAAYFIQYQLDKKNSASRGHGSTMSSSLTTLATDPRKWQDNSFDSKKVGCGVTMRNAIMGAMLAKLVTVDLNNQNIDEIVEALSEDVKMCSVISLLMKSGYVTHTSPLGFLGGVQVGLSALLKEKGVPIAQIPFIVQKMTEKNRIVYQEAARVVKFNDESQETKQKYDKQWDDAVHVGQYYLNYRFPENKLSVTRDDSDETDHLLTQLTFDKGEESGGYPGQNFNGSKLPDRVVSDQYEDNLWGASDGISAYWNAEDMYLRTMNAFLNDFREKYERNETIRDLIGTNYPTLNQKINNESPLIDQINAQELQILMRYASEEIKKKTYYGVIERSALHGGDSDSTATVAMFFYGQTAGENGLVSTTEEALLEKCEEKQFLKLDKPQIGKDHRIKGTQIWADPLGSFKGWLKWFFGMSIKVKINQAELYVDRASFNKRFNETQPPNELVNKIAKILIINNITKFEDAIKTQAGLNACVEGLVEHVEREGRFNLTKFLQDDKKSKEIIDAIKKNNSQTSILIGPNSDGAKLALYRALNPS